MLMQSSYLLVVGGSLRVLDLSCSSLVALPHFSGLTVLSSLNLSWCVACARYKCIKNIQTPRTISSPVCTVVITLSMLDLS